MAILTLKDMDFRNKRVLVRFDYNVPMKNGKVENDKRIKASLPTIKYLIAKQAKIIIMTSVGRPEGIDESLRTNDIALKLGQMLGITVKKSNDCIGDVAKKDVEALKPGEVLLLENLRFYAEEESNDPSFAKQLSSLGDIYVNDAFANSHREHASMYGITKFIPSCAGILLEKEVNTILEIMESPKKPFVVIIGGAKLETKIPVINKLLKKADKILLGGAMVFNFYKAQGLEIGKSKYDKDQLLLAKELAKKAGDKLILPIDIVIADGINQMAYTETVDIESIKKDLYGLDIGLKTVKMFADEIADAKTIMWNGPMGVYEIDKFAKGTNELAKAIAKVDAIKVVGGGDSVAAIEKLGMEDKFTLVSTGGGASLTLIEKGTLPGIKALEDAAKKNKLK